MTMQREITLGISGNDLQFLVSLGDTEFGCVMRGEVAEMCGVSSEAIDTLVLSIIYG